MNEIKPTNDELWEKPDKVRTYIDENGKKFIVEIVYGDEDWRDVIAGIIRDFYMD